MSNIQTTTIERILIAYDGSASAQDAIATAARLFPGAHAEVVHAWQALAEEQTTAVVAAAWGAADELVESESRTAEALTAEGTGAARSAGLTAIGRIMEGDGGIAELLLAAIADVRPDLVVMGTRALHGVRGAIAGSTSQGVIARSPVPVLVVSAAHRE
jgi:nucleotide-binding universal stress UspA family protein